MDGTGVAVMTGGTSGFGAIAADRIAAAGPLMVGTRAGSTPVRGAEAIQLDLASLDSVRQFCRVVREHLSPGSAVSRLVLNAGIVLPTDAERTVDGFETTFAVNHAAQFLLLCELLPVLTDDAVVVLTSSGTHDPATGARCATHGTRTPRCSPIPTETRIATSIHARRASTPTPPPSSARC